MHSRDALFSLFFAERTMSDLAIHRRLVAGEATAVDLDEIASWSLARRVAYVGAIEPLCMQGEGGTRSGCRAAGAGGGARVRGREDERRGSG